MRNPLLILTLLTATVGAAAPAATQVNNFHVRVSASTASAGVEVQGLQFEVKHPELRSGAVQFREVVFSAST